MISAVPAKASERDDVVVLQQDSVVLGNGATIELGPDWLQVNASASGIRVLSKAPNWEVFFVRASRKVYFSLPYKQALSRVSLLGIAGAMGASSSFKLPLTHSEFQSRGNRFFKYKFSGETFRDPYLTDTLKRDKVVVDYFALVTLQKNLPEQEVVIVSKLLALPVAKGIPYSLLWVFKNHPSRASIFTRTLSASKAQKPDFSFLRKYERSEKLEQVLVGDSSNQVMEELFK